MPYPPYLNPSDVEEAVRRALTEDVGTGDATTAATVPNSARAQAELRAKSAGVLAGVHVVEAAFRDVDASVEVAWERRDGDHVASDDLVAVVRGPARAILTAERTALNFLQRMSGIATATRAMVDAALPHAAKILDTRKTAPGLRLLDKWAVLIGGGQNHRVGLSDMILIKENHVASAGGVAKALEAARDWCVANGPLPIEIEVRTLSELDEVLRSDGADFILLDNMVRVDSSGVDTSMLEQAVRRVAGRIKTEASGNVTLHTVKAIAATGVDFISSGALTHSVQALDLSLTIHVE